MAALEALNAIVDKHGSEHDAKEPPKRRSIHEQTPRLMQHAHVPQNDGVSFSGQKKHSYARSGQRNENQKTNLPAVRTQAQQHDRQAEAIDGQTQVIRAQAVGQQKQSNLMLQQSGLMQDQLHATQEMSDVINRLAEYMQKQMTRPEAKVQRMGNTYEGEFTKINEKQLAAQERRMTVLDELREKRREMQRIRASKQERDRLGRFTRSAPKGPKLQRVGGGVRGIGGMLEGGMMEGMGGRAAGMAARAAWPLLALAAAYYGSKAMTAASDNYTFEKKDSNMVTRGWQNTKDWVGDKFRDDPGESFLDKATVKSGGKQQGELMGESARHKDFGSISAAFESGNKGVGTVSTGKGDKGGVSYGKHQLSSKAGTMTAFLRSEDGQKYYNDFRGMAPGSEEFNKKYKEVADRDGEGFDKAQQAFTTKTHYNPVAAWFEKQYDIKLDERSRALKECVYSVAVQYGLSTAKSVLADAFGNRDITKMPDAEMIDRVQETRAATVGTRFRSSSQDVQDSVYKRAGTEKAALLKMLNEEQGGPGSAKASGSGIGSQYSQQMIGVYGGKTSGANQSGTASNGTVGVMAMPQGGGGGMSGAGDEAGGGTAAGMLSPANGALYALGQKHVRPNDNSVNMSGLNDKFKQAFFTMVGDWVQNSGGTVVNVASAFRTRAEQEKLWIKYGRNTKRVARPGTSRHESGFAIDIDRNSASAMEGAGLFKKYGFHRPLSNEPWHVEMIGAGKGGAGGGPQVAAANASPQLMQQQASQEMDKAAEATVNRAEENTKGTEKTWSQKLNEKKPPTDSETGGTSKAAEANGAKAKAGLEEEEEEEEVGEKPDDIGENDTKIINKEVMPPTVDVMGGAPTTRTPEEQALYEQYLKQAGGDPRGVPETISNPGQNPFGSPELQRTNPGSGTPTWSQRNAGRGANGVPGSNGGYTSGQYGQRARPWSQSQTGRAITGAATKIGNVYGMGGFGTMAPGVFGGLRKVDGKVNDVLNKVPGLRELSRLPGIPQIPRLSNGLPSFGNIVTGVADRAAGLFGGNDAPVTVPANERPKVMNGMKVTYDGPAVTSTDQIGTTSVNASVPPMSPASPTYYNNDAPVVTRSAGAPVATLSSPAPTSLAPAPDKIERNSYDGVQKVAISSSDVPMGGSAPAPAAPGAPGAGSGGAKNDMPSIDDVPAIMDEYGLLFVNMGMV